MTVKKRFEGVSEEMNSVLVFFLLVIHFSWLLLSNKLGLLQSVSTNKI